MANGILLFQMGPARISPSLLTGSEECRHEIILQYLTVGLSPPLVSPQSSTSLSFTSSLSASLPLAATFQTTTRP